jgi:hypothetical protein
LTNRNPNVYRYQIVLAETQYNFCSFWFLNQQNDRAASQLAKSRATLLQALYIDPKNTLAAEQLVLFTQNIVDHLLEKKNLDMADRVLQEALQELRALKQESEEEYSGLEPSIETLRSMARKVRQMRIEAETPDDVASAIQG